jgi:hypothetical protein
MSEISAEAYDLLKTIKKCARKVGLGKYFSDSDICYWYDFDDEIDEIIKSSIKELLDSKFIRYWRDNDDEYILDPRGDNYTRDTNATVINNISNNNNSNIANMSHSINQAIDIDSLDESIKDQLNELVEAVKRKDQTRAQKIIDGLWISAPALILQMIQIGLGLNTK